MQHHRPSGLSGSAQIQPACGSSLLVACSTLEAYQQIVRLQGLGMESKAFRGGGPGLWWNSLRNAISAGSIAWLGTRAMYLLIGVHRCLISGPYSHAKIAVSPPRRI